MSYAELSSVFMLCFDAGDSLFGLNMYPVWLLEQTTDLSRLVTCKNETFDDLSEFPKFPNLSDSFTAFDSDE